MAKSSTTNIIIILLVVLCGAYFVSSMSPYQIRTNAGQIADVAEFFIVAFIFLQIWLGKVDRRLIAVFFTGMVIYFFTQLSYVERDWVVMTAIVCGAIFFFLVRQMGKGDI